MMRRPERPKRGYEHERPKERGHPSTAEKVAGTEDKMQTIVMDNAAVGERGNLQPNEIQRQKTGECESGAPPYVLVSFGR